MLSISKPLIGDAAGLYYVELGREDYYLEGGEPPGTWVGAGAAEFGLLGKVSKEEFMVLFRGFNPETGEALNKNSGQEGRRAGWDLTFSAPKSVSALWAVADEETRKSIQEIHQRAVERALSYVEEGAISRRGKGGAEREPCKLIIATFEHGTSRAQEPNLHTHSVILNIGLREDGTTGTLETAEIFKRKMAAGAIFRAELAAGLEKELGVKVKRERDFFELEEVSTELCSHWSTRRKEIKESLSEKGLEGSKAAAIAALDTRGAKEDLIPRAELQEKWKGEAKDYGLTPEKTKEMLGHEVSRDKEAEIQAAVAISLDELTHKTSTFTERELVASLAVNAQGRGISGQEALKTARQVLREDERVVLISEGREKVFSTKEHVELEEKLMKRVSALNLSAKKGVSKETLHAVFSSRTLSEEQKAAVRHLTSKESGAALAVGLPGTGKSYSLAAVREAFEKEGFNVLGAAPSGKAAGDLEAETGIKSGTIHKTLKDVDNREIVFNEKSVLIIDEAGMVPTRLLNEITLRAERANAKLVLIGDADQLQSIEAGGAFLALEKRLGACHLTEIRRQNELWAREVVRDFHQGDSEKGLRAFQERGLLTISETRTKAKEELISEWRKDGIHAPEKNLILAATRAEVRSLNEAAQKARLINSKLGAQTVTVEGQKLFVGDRVVINKNSKLCSVRNGDIGTVKKIQGKSITLQMARGKTAQFSTEDFPHVSLGYAITTHKAQGVTADNVFVLAGGPTTDKHMAVVQMSRARGDTKVFIEKDEAGGLNQIAKQMNKEQKKVLAIERLGAGASHRSGIENSKSAPSKNIEGLSIRITPPRRRLGF